MRRKILSLVILAALFVSLMTSCLFSRECEVTYDYAGARDNVTVTVAEGSLLPEALPTRKGYVFGGWYADAERSVSYDFSLPVTEDTTLFAKWIPKDLLDVDYESLVNSITQTSIRATVRFSVEKYNLNQKYGAFGELITSKKDVGTSSGSGVVYAEAAGYYYCLTNNHVVSKGSKTNADITITDYQLGTYSGELVAADANYDLAVVKFKKNIVEPLECLDIDSVDVAHGETVVAIGSPGGQMNAITFGKVLANEKVDVDASSTELSNVTFAVIRHNAPMDNGSSGGVLLSTELKIVGINYAAASSEGKFVFGYAVPAKKIMEFLTANDLLK